MTLTSVHELDDVGRLRRLLGRRLREERRKKRDEVPAARRARYSQGGIAERVRVDYTTVCRWETGHREPNLRGLDMTVNWSKIIRVAF